MRRYKQSIGFLVSRLAILLAILSLFTILFFIFVRGFRVLNLAFIFEFPKEGMTKGGIFPAIIGTLYLSIGAILFALPLGVLGAIYLTEYAKVPRLIRIIRIGINNLAGTPSVVFGLFGLAIFVKLFGFGVSIIAGALTLGMLILPVIIRAAEEAIIAVPQTFREASYALGATKWQTITRTVLPTAMPGILTGAILGVGRAAGETAPILFTAATFYTRLLPQSMLDEVMALPYHIYALMTEGTKPNLQVPIAYGTAVVLLVLVLGINLIAISIRIRGRRAKKW
ncbi:MAG TPA: phosphate ABC transporter permease PstA [bacterium (Candidatus Stahlbacteria)]|nr:phosphate ABC transporter permease PstA [Candidatus Stahlbacteria bacterium]